MDLITTFFNIDVLRQAAPLLLQGFWLTILLGATSLVISLALGLLLVLMRLYAPKPCACSLWPISTFSARCLCWCC
ncbi:hypothetical protein QWZ10_24325 [Paracoccus cavernae]|uniref:Amino acid ABC transporter permease n=1 Tax=Paracoccus cavernae TaxID=1571207 RepID=A0ABT8DGQ3_9RHOB|nr:hypothetical protein [Paracoccus cavernae]